jgi:hypothetical protein
MYACNPGTWEAKVEHHEFEARLSYIVRTFLSLSLSKNFTEYITK